MTPTAFFLAVCSVRKGVMLWTYYYNIIYFLKTVDFSARLRFAQGGVGAAGERMGIC
jgi:hypothetical protein